MLDHLLIPLQGNEKVSDVSALLEFSRRFSSTRVTFAHVGPDTRRCRKRLEVYTSTATDLNFKCDIFLRHGHIARTICNAVDETESDIICFPWRGKTVLERTLFGSVSQDVIRLTTSPVFIFKRKLQYFRDGIELSSILYATAFRDTDAEVMPYLAYEGLKAERLVILNVGRRAPDPMAEAARVERVQAALDRLRQECAQSYQTVETCIDLGSPRRKIVKQAARQGIDVIVVGKSDRPAAADDMLGSTAEYIPHHSICSVMILPGS